MDSNSKGTYVLLKHIGINQPYHWVLRASNNEVILKSENYTTRQGAENGIASCRINSQVDARYEKRISKASEPYFVLKGGNGEIIGVSEMYSSNSARDNGIASVKAHGQKAVLIDRS